MGTEGPFKHVWSVCTGSKSRVRMLMIGSESGIKPMPKSKGRKHPSGPPPRQPVRPPMPALMGPALLGYNPNGPSKQRDIVEVKNGWSEYTLDDGAIIRVKGVLIDAKQFVGQFNTVTGEPIYGLQLSVVHELVVPDSLKKPKITSEAAKEAEVKK